MLVGGAGRDAERVVKHLLPNPTSEQLLLVWNGRIDELAARGHVRRLSLKRR